MTFFLVSLLSLVLFSFCFGFCWFVIICWIVCWYFWCFFVSAEVWLGSGNGVGCVGGGNVSSWHLMCYGFRSFGMDFCDFLTCGLAC